MFAVHVYVFACLLACLFICLLLFYFVLFSCVVSLCCIAMLHCYVVFCCVSVFVYYYFLDHPEIWLHCCANHTCTNPLTNSLIHTFGSAGSHRRGIIGAV